MKHTYYAEQDLSIEGKKVKAGDVVATIETDLSPEKILPAILRGLATKNAPAVSPTKEGGKNAPAVSPAKEGN